MQTTMFELPAIEKMPARRTCFIGSPTEPRPETQLRMLPSTPSFYSPIGYLGGKKRMWKLIEPLIPTGLTEIACPFAGGAAIELRLAASGIRVHASDNLEPLINFWQQFLADPRKLAAHTTSLIPLDRDYIKEFVKNDIQSTLPNDERAAYFWIINKVSWCGITLKGIGFNYTPVHTNYFEDERWYNWHNPNITFDCLDYADALARHHDKFLYLDPPYVGRENFYGKYGEKVTFDHVDLAARLKAHKAPWLMSYGNDPLIWELYQDYEITTPHLTYTSRALRGSERPEESVEIFIKNC